MGICDGMEYCDGKHCGTEGSFKELYTWNRYNRMIENNYIIKQNFCNDCLDFSSRYEYYLTHFKCFNCKLLFSYEEYFNKKNVSFNSEGGDLLMCCDSCLNDDSVIKYNTTTNMVGETIYIYKKKLILKKK